MSMYIILVIILFFSAIIYKRTLKTHHHTFALFMQTVYAIEKSLAGFNVQPRNGMNSVINLTALSRDTADDVTWVHTTSSTFLHS